MEVAISKMRPHAISFPHAIFYAWQQSISMWGASILFWFRDTSLVTKACKSVKKQSLKKKENDNNKKSARAVETKNKDDTRR